MPNAPHKYPQYSLRIPEAVMDKLKYIAEYNARSGNREIELLIREHIAAFEKEHGEIKNLYPQPKMPDERGFFGPIKANFRRYAVAFQENLTMSGTKKAAQMAFAGCEYGF